ncbi:RagB/SusD family nutrient uptake outer membrane protein [Leeuwenhoekiella marinoflava]|uniref:RagB/SusD family nutrient uptake outer membrane protein n=1 Tax=Leeuwenhoekiella marinoflava TaxID=988 RepID=UPI003002114B
MKKIVYTLSYLTLVLFLTGCSDFLEEDNKSNATAEDFYITAEGYQSLLNANYAQLRELYGNSPWLYACGTDLYAEGRDREPLGLSRYTNLNPSSEGVGALYDTAFKAIQTANTAVYYYDLTETTDVLDQQLGEVRFLRANAYFLLVQTYGGVPLITEYFREPVLSFDRAEAEAIYDFIITELEAALPAVSTGAYQGKVTQRAVNHLLAKVYLTRGYESFGTATDFETAASYADAAIAGQSLDLSFEELWSPDYAINSETLFSVQYDAASVSTDPFSLGHMQTSYFGPYQGGSEVAGDAPYRTYTLCPTQFAIDLFTEDDTRYATTFMTEVYERYFDFYDVENTADLPVAEYYEPAWKATQTERDAYMAEHPDATYHSYGSYAPSVRPSIDYQTIPVRKFDDPGAPFGARTSRRDIVLARLGETYLIAAEAYLMANQATTGLSRLNVVRDRAGVDDATLAEFDIDYILDERGRELLGEYHRWFDLKRTGKLVERASAHHYLVDEENFVGVNGELKILRPIPQDAIDLNQNRDFKQNPAYQ